MIETFAVTGVDGLAFGLLLFTVAAGLTLIYGVMGVLNLAHGSLYLAGAYLASGMVNDSLPTLGLAVAAATLLGAGGGVLLDHLTRPLTGDQSHLSQALVTMGLALLAADAFNNVFGAAPRPVPPPTVLGGSIHLGAMGYPAYRLVFIAVGTILAVGLHWVLRHTTTGVTLRAVIADPQMAAATGIHHTRVRAGAFAVGGALATAGGVLGAPILGPAPGIDTTVLTLSLVVVVIGGTGSVLTTLAAALLVGQVQTTGVLAAPLAAPFALFTVMVVVLVLTQRTNPQARLR